MDSITKNRLHGVLPVLLPAIGNAWQRIHPVQHILYVLVAGTLLWSSHGIQWRTLLLVTLIEIIATLRTISSRTNTARTATGDVASILFLFFGAWYLATTALQLLDPMLVPGPEAVLTLFVAELPDTLKGLRSSLLLLVSGYGLAILTAIPLGLMVGYHRRTFHATMPFTKLLGTIPPVVYIPYAIHFLPSFTAASVTVIFIGAFWPIFINTISGVFNVPSGIIDSARVFNLNTRTMLVRVILPASLPSICTGATLALCFSFLMLTMAEMIGGSSGMGWYISNFSEFADYPRVIVGILFIGIVVTTITFFTERLERHLLRWRV